MLEKGVSLCTKMKSIISILSIFIALNSFGANFDQFLNVIAKVESNNNPKAVGDKGLAIGAYQIHYLYFLDAQRFDKSLKKYKYQNCFDKEVSRKVVIAYLKGYESISISKGDWQTLAKLHNGGPSKNKSPKAKKMVDSYWKKVRLHL